LGTAAVPKPRAPEAWPLDSLSVRTGWNAIAHLSVHRKG
jgi:hypothetical protein